MPANSYDHKLDETIDTNDIATEYNDPTIKAFRESAAPTITSTMDRTADGLDTRAPSPSQSLSNRDIEKEGAMNEKTQRRSGETSGDENEKEGGKGSVNEIVVDWEGPNDPMNPKKCVVCLLTFQSIDLTDLLLLKIETAGPPAANGPLSPSSPRSRSSRPSLLLWCPRPRSSWPTTLV